MSIIEEMQKEINTLKYTNMKLRDDISYGNEKLRQHLETIEGLRSELKKSKEIIDNFENTIMKLTHEKFKVDTSYELAIKNVIRMRGVKND